MREISGVYVMRVASMLTGMHPQTLRKYERAGLVMRGRVSSGIRAGLKIEGIIGGLEQDYPVSHKLYAKSLKELKEQAEGRWEVPTDRVVTVEGWEGYVIVSCAFGLNINKTLSRLLGYLLTIRTGSGVGTSQDAYRIFLKTTLDPHVVAEALRAIDPDKAEHMAEVAVERTGLFKRRLLHVAKRFGVIEKDADVSDVGMTQLVEGLKDTVVWKEAMKEVLLKDLDVSGTIRVVHGIREGRFEISVMPGDLPLSPISRVGIKELSWKTDLVPADRLRRLLIESGKARLLNEARVAVCVNCFRYVENVKAKKFLGKVKCPECGSSKIGLLSDDPLEVTQMAAEKSETDKVSERFKLMYKSALEGGELVSLYGLPAVLALVAKGLPKPMMITLATSEIKDLDYFVDLILKEERAALKSRYRSRSDHELKAARQAS